MVAPSPVIKKTAKTALSGHWLQSIVVSVMFVFSFFIGELAASLVSIVSGNAGYIIFSALFAVFILSPLSLGVLCWFRRILWGQNDGLLLIFKYFSNKNEYMRAVHLTLILTVKIAVSAIIMFFPCIIVWVLSSEWFYLLLDLPFPVWTSSLWTLNSFLAIIGALGLVFVAVRYYLSAFLFVSDSNIHPAEAVNMSTIISKRSGGDFIGLVLSFAGWLLLSLFIAPLIFTLPYFIESYVVHCRYAITAYNRDIDRFNAQNMPYYRADEV